ncbi:MAG: AAA family ATPase [Ktedonobacteraceae bacterium]
MIHNSGANDFVQTRQYLRFAEFVDSCRSTRSIGVCTGRPGIGKEASAQAYARWHTLKPLLENPLRSPPTRVQNCHTAYWDAEISCTLKRLRTGLSGLRSKFDSLARESLYWYEPERFKEPPRAHFLELFLINNAHRLPYQCLDAINDFRKKHQIGFVLLAAPGFDRKIKHYDMVGCDVALFHEYEEPRLEEFRQILELRWRNEEVTVEDAAIDVIKDVTRSNIQKALNVQAEIERVRKINSMSIITPEIVEAASTSLLLDVPRPK